MRSIAKLLGAVAVVAVLTGASSAGATTTLTPINSSTLNSTGTAIYGATISDLGAFTNIFTFTTLAAAVSASASIVTIEQQNGSKDIDFSSVSLDGNAFTQTGFDPFPETWGLAAATLASGTHSIVVMGTVVSLGSGGSAASYSGTLNIDTLTKSGGTPEPSTWALMILGFGGAGAMLRARRRTFAA